MPSRTDAPARRAIVVVTPWKRRWEMGNGAGLADDFHFVRACTAHGFDVHYVSPRDDAPLDLAFPGYFVHSFANFFDATATWPTALRRIAWPFLFGVLAGWRAWSVARRTRADIVLGQTHVAAGVTFAVGALRSIPSVVKLFGVMDLVRSDWPSTAYLRRNLESILAFKLPIDAWIILDDGTRGDVAARRHGVAEQRIHFFPNAVNRSWQARPADPGWFRDTARVSDGHAIVFYLARLADWKRPEAFVRAAARMLSRTRRPVTCVVAGDGPERSRCESLARSLGVSASVRFVGPIPHERVPDAFAASVLFAATSERSNKSIATCEALLCGVPVVAFDVGATGDVVRDGDTGRLIRDGDVDALGDAMAALVDDEETRAAMGRRAREFARDHFVDWQDRTAMETALLRRLIGP